MTIGAVVGVIDVIPMVFRKLDKYSYLFIPVSLGGDGIGYSSCEREYRFMGERTVAELSAIPVIIIVSKEGNNAIFSMIELSAILGLCIGMAGSQFIS